MKESRISFFMILLRSSSDRILTTKPTPSVEFSYISPGLMSIAVSFLCMLYVISANVIIYKNQQDECHRFGVLLSIRY